VIWVRKAIFLLVCLFAFPLICSAEPIQQQQVFFDTSNTKKVVGIFLEAPVTYVNNEKVRILVPEKTIPLFPRHLFTVLPFDKSSMALRTYKEDNRMVMNQYYSQPVNRSDIQKIAKELKADYALFIIISNGPPRVGAGLFSVSFRTTVTCDVRLLDVETGQYLASREIVKDGQSTAVYMGVPSFDNAYNEALEKALSELTLDTASLLKTKEKTE